VIDGVAFVPASPVLIPEVAQGAAHELDDLRAACRTAIRAASNGAERIVLVGAGPSPRTYGPGARGSLAGFGVDLTVQLGTGEAGPVQLPPSLTVGAWLVRDALADPPPVTAHAFPGEPVFPRSFDPDPAGKAALVVVGDGSARRSTTAPGYFDPRAEGFDAAVAGALRDGRAADLAVDAASAEELLIGGATVWAAIAGELGSRAWDARLLYDAAPYGVGYFVAVWT